MTVKPIVNRKTHFERLFSVAALYDSHMDSGNIGDSNASPSELIWIHSSGMSLQWDAPLEMQEHFKGETDPEPRVFFSPTLSDAGRAF